MSADEQLSIRRIFGAEVETLEGEAIGEIEDIVFDTTNDRLLVALLFIYGTEERFFVVPWGLFSRPEEGKLAVDTTREKIIAGPYVTRSEYLSPENRDWMNQVHSYYSKVPYPESGRSAVVSERRNSSRFGAGWMFALVALVVIAGLLIYTVTTGRWSSTSASLQEAADTVKQTSDNASTTARVKAAFALSERISSLDIDVDSNDGVVTLKGQVPSQEVKDLAGLICEETSGVREVKNLLVVGRAKTASGPR